MLVEMKGKAKIRTLVKMRMVKIMKIKMKMMLK